MNIVIDKKSENLMDKLNNAINKNGSNIFIFVSAEWCGHCKTTIPEWNKLENNDYGDNVVIARVDSDLHDKIEGFGEPASGFPDLRYINKSQGIIEKYNSGRTIQDFNDWITSKTNKNTTAKKTKAKEKTKSKEKTNAKTKTNKRHVKGAQYGGKYRKSVRSRSRSRSRSRRRKSMRSRR